MSNCHQNITCCVIIAVGGNAELYLLFTVHLYLLLHHFVHETNISVWKSYSPLDNLSFLLCYTNVCTIKCLPNNGEPQRLRKK